MVQHIDFLFYFGRLILMEFRRQRTADGLGVHPSRERRGHRLLDNDLFHSVSSFSKVTLSATAFARSQALIVASLSYSTRGIGALGDYSGRFNQWPTPGNSHQFWHAWPLPLGRHACPPSVGPPPLGSLAHLPRLSQAPMRD